MRETANRVDRLLETHPPEGWLERVRIESNSLVYYEKMDSKNYKKIEHHSEMTPHEHAFADIHNSLPKFIEMARENKKQEYAVVTTGPNFHGEDSVYLKILSNGDVIYFIMKIKHAYETIELNQEFLLGTSVLVFILAFIIILLISSVIGRKMETISSKTKKMGNLDFSDPIIIKNSDEIGKLSMNINELSHKLEDVIEELKDSNDRLNIELQKERSMEQMRRQFVSDVSHELKNPLSMIQGYADGLYHNIPKTEADKKYYQKVIVEEADRLGKLLKDLLDLSSYESGVFSLTYNHVDINALIEDIVERYRLKVEEKRLRIQMNFSSMPMIPADVRRLEQVIVNLLSNAVKYSNDEGQIYIRSKRVSDHVEFYIANTGELLSEKQMGLIWNSFHQVDSTKTGNGLGLPIIKSIVKLHQGECSVSIEDNMNCFRVVLPLTQG